jgi:type II secretory pathway pseudopilin PulG
MKRRAENSAGYTITEVVIVLAVSGGLFAMVALMFNGRQANASLLQSVRDMESKIHSVTSDVANGYYPNGFHCDALSPGPVTVNSGTSATPGANVGCVFLGKIMAFGDNKALLLTTVGRQFKNNSTTDTTSDLTEAIPVVITGVIENYTYGFGLHPVHIYDASNNSSEYDALAFLSELSGGVSNGNPLTGSRTTLLYGVQSSTFPGNAVASTVAGQVNAATLIPLPSGARICLIGGNGKHAEITVGASGDQLSTNVLIDSGVTSVC